MSLIYLGWESTYMLREPGGPCACGFRGEQGAGLQLILGILVKMDGWCRQLGKTLGVANGFAIKHRIAPNLQVGSCLMSICINNGALDHAWEPSEGIKHDSDYQLGKAPAVGG